MGRHKTTTKKKTARTKIPSDIRQLVLHEAGYHCANPNCRTVLTLDIHHIEYVSQEGSNEPSNLLPLCPNCHALHHSGVISLNSVRTWKMLLLALNEAFDKRQRLCAVLRLQCGQ
jgi:5-methylcytosine-specific restriction endonuclease McrA